MNFISHQYFNPRPDDNWFTVGICLPDMFKFTGKRVPSTHTVKVLERYTGTCPRIRAVVQGMLNHIRYDRIFHNSEFFLKKCEDLAGLIKEHGLHIPRVATFSHLIIEIALDSLLNKKEPHHVEAIYKAFAGVDLGYVLEGLTAVYDYEPAVVKERIENFMKKDYLRSYRDSYGIYDVCNRVFRRLLGQDLSGAKHDIIAAADLTLPLLEDFEAFYSRIANT